MQEINYVIKASDVLERTKQLAANIAAKQQMLSQNATVFDRLAIMDEEDVLLQNWMDEAIAAFRKLSNRYLNTLKAYARVIDVTWEIDPTAEKPDVTEEAGKYYEMKLAMPNNYPIEYKDELKATILQYLATYILTSWLNQSDGSEQQAVNIGVKQQLNAEVATRQAFALRSRPFYQPKYKYEENVVWKEEDE